MLAASAAASNGAQTHHRRGSILHCVHPSRKSHAKLTGARLANAPASSGAPPSLQLSQLLGSQVWHLTD